MTIPARSRAQLVSRAYAILGLAEVGQSEDAVSLAVIDNLVEPLIARLNEERITWHVDAEGNVTQLDDPDAIPAKTFMDVAVLLAYDAMGDFSLAALPPPHTRTESEMRLRTVWAVKEATQEAYEHYDEETGAVSTRYRNETLAGEYM